ncbi:hypothetical protein [Streptomyces sp. NPDC101237]|uniref:hypothetical protein n=1 Tax=Streptomyces sp. NPDC101237 TaxID=3366139 RepID=UPI0037FB4524
MSIQQPEGQPKSWFITLFFRSASKVPDLRSDVEPPDGRTPRKNVIDHIQEKIKDCEGPTVGEGIVAAIQTLRDTAGERGAREIDSVFLKPELTQYYRRPLDDLDAHKAIAVKEVEYWLAEHKKKESGGTRSAVAFTVQDRVQLQHGFGKLNEFSKTLDPSSTRYGPGSGYPQYSE